MREMPKKKILVIVVAVVALFTVLGLYLSSTETKGEEQKRLLSNAEEASIKWIQSGLDVYYIENNRYPTLYDEFIEIEKAKPNTEEIISTLPLTLKDLSYSVRGDYQAYWLVYTSHDGTQKEVSGNYKEDYH